MIGGRTYYEVLGVNVMATADEITVAYRVGAMKMHPDRNPSPDATTLFQNLQQAYAVLRDSGQRSEYDSKNRLGRYSPGPTSSSRASPNESRQGKRARRGGAEAGTEGRYGKDNDRPWHHYDDDPHWQPEPPPPPPPPPKAANVRRKVQLSLWQQVRGCKWEVEVAREVPCKACAGLGSVDGPRQRCPDCKGNGLNGKREVCGTCEGEGVIDWKVCPKCRGTGGINTQKKIMVTIPPGAKVGQEFRVRGEGKLGVNGGENGDLLLVIELGTDPLFTVVGFPNLRLKVPISPFLAMLGGDIAIPTVTGSRTITLPAGLRQGQTVPVPLEGLRGTSGRGQLLIEINIEPIRAVSPEIKAALAEFEEQRRRRDTKGVISEWERRAYDYVQATEARKGSTG